MTSQSFPSNPGNPNHSNHTPVPPSSNAKAGTPGARGPSVPGLNHTGPAHPSPLLTYIHARFREVLGAPNSTLALDSQWSIRSGPAAPAIFVLVNGSYEKPAVWIFDPYTAENVWRTSITSTGEVDAALKEIKRRVASAAATWHGA